MDKLRVVNAPPQDDEEMYECVCPKTHKGIMMLGEYLRCPHPCDFMNVRGLCPWGTANVERRMEIERRSVAFECGKGGCVAKPLGLLWAEVYEPVD